MTELFTLYSSSAGNCTCLCSEKTVLLIDAGGSCRKITSALKEHGVNPSCISGIVLTHEHSDHIAALQVLLRNVPAPVFGTPATLGYLEDHGLIPEGIPLCPVPSDGVGGVIGDIAFETFPTSHDAGDTCGYTFQLPDGQRIGFATDLGRFTDPVFQSLRDCGTVVLESNYDPHMLEASRYPYPLKRRIKGATGHLSNEDCAAAAVRLAQGGVRRMILAHTSKENNLEELAYTTTYAALQAAGLGKSREEFLLEVAPKYACSPVLAL